LTDQLSHEAELQAENERLRSEVERLSTLLYGPVRAEPEPHKPERETCYLLAGKGNRPLAEFIRDRVRERKPGVAWDLVFEVGDIPKDGRVVDAYEAFRGMWGDPADEWLRQPRLYRRQGDKLVYIPTEDQVDALRRLLEQVDGYLTRADETRSQEYLLLVDLALASFNLLLGHLNAGDCDWRPVYEGMKANLARHRANVEEKLGEHAAS
jgi:hypothetical protein